MQSVLSSIFHSIVENCSLPSQQSLNFLLYKTQRRFAELNGKWQIHAVALWKISQIVNSVESRREQKCRMSERILNYFDWKKNSFQLTERLNQKRTSLNRFYGKMNVKFKFDFLLIFLHYRRDFIELCFAISHLGSNSIQPTCKKKLNKNLPNFSPIDLSRVSVKFIFTFPWFAPFRFDLNHEHERQWNIFEKC